MFSRKPLPSNEILNDHSGLFSWSVGGIGDHRALPIGQPFPLGSSGQSRKFWDAGEHSLEATSETKLLSSSSISWLWLCVFFERTRETEKLRNLSHEVNRKRRGRTQMVYRGKQGGKPQVLFWLEMEGLHEYHLWEHIHLSSGFFFKIQFIGVTLVHMIIWQWFPALFSQSHFLFAFFGYIIHILVEQCLCPLCEFSIHCSESHEALV